MVSEKKCAKSEISEISLLLMRWPADPSSVFHLVSPVTTGRSFCLRARLINAPSILRRAFHLAPSRHPVPRQAPRQAGTGGAGGVVFSKLSKLLNQEDALSAPCFTR